MNACLTRNFVAGLGGLTLALRLGRGSVARRDTDTRAILRHKPDCGMFQMAPTRMVASRDRGHSNSGGV